MELQTEHHLESVGQLEVLPGPTGRRQWPDALKGRIVAESFLPGAQVKEVAHRHGLAANHLSTWRRMARDGKLPVPVDDAAVFAELVLEDAPAHDAINTGRLTSPVEIVVEDVVVRLTAEHSARDVAVLVSALRALS